MRRIQMRNGISVNHKLTAYNLVKVPVVIRWHTRGRIEH